MKKSIILTLIFITSIVVYSADAQVLYDVDTRNEKYQPLSGSTVLTSATAWEDTVVVINIPFSFKLNNKTTNQIYLQDGALAVTDTALSNAIFLASTELVDRGVADSTMKSRSPMSYVVDGAPGDRILKIEIANAGFGTEWSLEDTTTGYLNIQLWLYEKDNVFEVRYGDAYSSNFSRDFPMNLMTGIMNNVDMGKGTIGTMYTLNGDPQSPTFDSVDMNTMNGGFTYFPSTGAVYRFTPKSPTTHIEKTAHVASMKVYPIQCSGHLIIENPNRMSSTYRIVSISGQILKHGSIDAGINKLDVSTLPQGMYVVRFDYNAGYETQKIYKL